MYAATLWEIKILKNVEKQLLYEAVFLLLCSGVQHVIQTSFSAFTFFILVLQNMEASLTIVKSFIRMQPERKSDKNGNPTHICRLHYC